MVLVGQNIETGWVSTENGYEVTRSKDIINYTISRLKQERVMLTLLQKNYQSGNTMLIDYDAEQILIDKPVDWPRGITQIRAVFRDNAKLWHHFTLVVTSVDKDTLYAKWPTELFLLQRRCHYRIEVPRGGQVAFTYEGQKMRGFFLEDVSAGGMLIFTNLKRNIILFKNKILTDISLALLVHEGDSQDRAYKLLIKEGEVMRGFRNEEACLIYFGIKFTPNHAEEEALLKYVRQRELAIIRKGM